MKGLLLVLSCLRLTACSFEQNAHNPVALESTAEQAQITDQKSDTDSRYLLIRIGTAA